MTFKAGGLSEIILHKENGYVARYDDTKDLIDGVNYILNLSPEKIKALSSASRERARGHFDRRRMVDQYLDLYAKMVSKPLL